MAIKDALNLIGTIDNASGQICQMKDEKPNLILFEFACPHCSEVASKNADEYGNALATIVNGTAALIAQIESIISETRGTAHSKLGRIRELLRRM